MSCQFNSELAPCTRNNGLLGRENFVMGAVGLNYVLLSVLLLNQECLNYLTCGLLRSSGMTPWAGRGWRGTSSEAVIRGEEPAD